MNSVQTRMRYWRRKIAHLSLRELQEAVNRHLPPAARVSLGTVSNYERESPSGGGGAGPRAEFLAALKRAFPELRLAWLLLGEGEPTELAERLAAARELTAAGSAETGDGSAPGASGDALGALILRSYPDLDLLAPEASALFVAALTRYAMGEPRMRLTEAQLLELAGDLRWLLLLPFRLWGFQHRPRYEEFASYSVALLHALMQAMPETAGGDAIETYERSPIRGLRASIPVGFESETVGTPEGETA